MIYLSTLSFLKNSLDYFHEFCNSDYGIEFSSGGLGHNYNNYKKFEGFNGKKILHNYFPGYKTSPFVLNLSSLDDEIKKRSLKHCFRNIDKTSRFSSDKFFAVHAGFRLDLKVSDLGKPVKDMIIGNVEEYEKSFYDSLKQLINYGEEKNVNILIENNVLIKENYDGLNLPFFAIESENISKILEDFSSYRNFGLLLDTAHLKVSCNTLGLNLREEFNKIKKYIKAIHHSDNDGNYDTNSKLDEYYWFLDFLSEFKNMPNVLEVKNLTIRELHNQLKILG